MTKMELLIISCGLLAATYSTEVPALSFQPVPPVKDSALIWYNASNPSSTSYWTNRLDKFLEPYTKCRDPKSPIGEPPQPNSGRVCEIQIDTWFPCTARNGYGYNSSSGGPCVFLKLDKLIGWVPDYHNSSTIPEDMPSNLKTLIQTIAADSKQNKILWMSCEGETPADVENIGPRVYYPNIGFDGQYFPLLNVDGYLSPLVAIYFTNPTRGIVINVKCNLWARNIDRDRYLSFQLLIDD